MKLNGFFLIAIPVFASLFSSCEGNTDYEWIIQNDASSLISVKANNAIYQDSTKTNIASNQQEKLMTYSMLGGSSKPLDPGASFSDLLILNSDGDTLKKDYQLNTNWNITITTVSKIPANYKHQYLFQVTDNDF